MNRNTLDNRLAAELERYRINRDRATDFFVVAWAELMARGVIPEGYDWTPERQELFAELFIAQLDAGWRITGVGTILADITALIHTTWWRMQNQLRRAEAEPAPQVTTPADDSPMPIPGGRNAEDWIVLFDWIYSHWRWKWSLDDVAKAVGFSYQTVKYHHSLYQKSKDKPKVHEE